MRTKDEDEHDVLVIPSVDVDAFSSDHSPSRQHEDIDHSSDPCDMEHGTWRHLFFGKGLFYKTRLAGLAGLADSSGDDCIVIL